MFNKRQTFVIQSLKFDSGTIFRPKTNYQDNALSGRYTVKTGKDLVKPGRMATIISLTMMTFQIHIILFIIYTQH